MYKRKKLNILSLLFGIVVFFILFGSFFAEQDWDGIFNNIKKQVQVETDLYDVIYVIDGDTIIVNIDGVDTKVRLIGIDCPESVHEDQSKNTPEGKLASEFTTKLLEGQKVKLEYDVQTKDSYDRTLAYVYLEDGTMVNEKIIAEGYAYPLTITPNVKYQDKIGEAFQEAVKNKKGLWLDEN